ncbi:MAG TPA: tryptophan-rich sensory protein [Candidatus Bilamarchaeaceae archaeon]|nr:tryptophan-rich sensory protein [Candidatus Bilamarchaeaceae archaeon]
MQKVNWAKLVGCVLLCQMAGVIGSFFTMDAIPGWYAGLEKPDLAPPNWVFAPVWISLYALMGVALYIVWEEGLEKKGVKGALLVFGAQLVVNAAWSIVFFGMQSPMAAFFVIILLWALIIEALREFYGISRWAGLALVPYLLWVSFAALLNFAIWMLNP